MIWSDKFIIVSVRADCRSCVNAGYSIDIIKQVRLFAIYEIERGRPRRRTSTYSACKQSLIEIQIPPIFIYPLIIFRALFNLLINMRMMWTGFVMDSPYLLQIFLYNSCP